MNNTIITGALELVAVTDGSQFRQILQVAGVAAQSYTESGAYFPDWSMGDGPTFTPLVFDSLVSSNTPKPWKYGASPDAQDDENNYIQAWYYNGIHLEWAAVSGQTGIYRNTSYDTNLNGLFELDFTDPSAPVVQIIKNIPKQISAADNDYLEFRGEIYSGQGSYPITMGREIKINLLSGGDPFKVEISLENGNAFDGDSNTNDSLYVDAVALLSDTGIIKKDPGHTPGSESSAHSGIFNLRAIQGSTTYKIDLSDSIGIDRYYLSDDASATPVMIANTPCPTQGFFIRANDVGGECLLVFKLIATTNDTDNVLAIASEKISDLGDPDVIAFSPVATAGANSRTTSKEVRRDEDVDVTMMVMKRNGGTDVSASYTLHDFVVRQSGSTTDITSNVTRSGHAFSRDSQTGHATWGTSYALILNYGAILATVKATKN